MKRSKSRAMLLVMLSLAACGRSDRDFRERQDANMRVQVTRMKSDPEDTGMVAYRLRIVPSATFRTIHPELGADHFWYRMDSCFYLNDKGRPRYPLLVQPVANGAKDNFEYILQFGREMQTDSAELVYSDSAAGIATYKFKLAY